MVNKGDSVLEPGQQAPDFELNSNNGGTIRLSGLVGKPVVLYFYPKDDTPGCTIEANGFQRHLQAFEDAGAVVLGVSPDSVKSHCKFAEKYALAFHLLADEAHHVAESYGVWVEKKRCGRTYWGIQRATFLLDARGKITHLWHDVKPEGHPEEVLSALSGLTSSE